MNRKRNFRQGRTKSLSKFSLLDCLVLALVKLRRNRLARQKPMSKLSQRLIKTKSAEVVGLVRVLSAVALVANPEAAVVEGQVRDLVLVLDPVLGRTVADDRDPILAIDATRISVIVGEIAIRTKIIIIEVGAIHNAVVDSRTVVVDGITTITITVEAITIGPTITDRITTTTIKVDTIIAAIEAVIEAVIGNSKCNDPIRVAEVAVDPDLAAAHAATVEVSVEVHPAADLAAARTTIVAEIGMVEILEMLEMLGIIGIIGKLGILGILAHTVAMIRNSIEMNAKVEKEICSKEVQFVMRNLVLFLPPRSR